MEGADEDDDDMEIDDDDDMEGDNKMDDNNIEMVHAN